MNIFQKSIVIFFIFTVLGVALYWFFPNNLALFTHIFSIAFLVLSLDLVTGYNGVATLGHAALFGTGAYAAGIASVHFHIQDPMILTIIAMVFGAFMGLISGILICRVYGLAQLVLSIAFVQLLGSAANKASVWTGGSDGLYGIEISPLLGIFAFDLWGKTAYFYGLFLLIFCFILLFYAMHAPFGLLCRAIKQDKQRIESLGIKTIRYRLLLFSLSGAVAAIGGALSAIATQVVGLDSLSFTLSAQSLVMLILGGAGTLYGALIGSFVFLLLEDFISALNPFYWLAIMGALLIITLLCAPKGLYGFMVKIPHFFIRRR